MGNETTKLPRFVMLELTNACDLACRHCPYHGEGVVKHRPIGLMPDRLWRAAVEEVLAWNTEVVLQPWGMGEPVLAPQLWEVVAIAKSSPRVEVGIYTNGNQWQERDVVAALSSGIDWVSFSIDGLRRDVFEHYRVGADLDRVLRSLRTLAAARRAAGRRKPEIRVNMVKYPELHDHEAEFVAAMREHVDAVEVSRFRRVGDRRFSPIELPRVPCQHLHAIMPIGWDGRVGMCCEDQQGEVLVGHFPEQSLREIWFGEPMQRLRRAHAEGRWGELPICAGCDAWTGPFERVTEREDHRVRERTAGTTYEFHRRADA